MCSVRYELVTVENKQEAFLLLTLMSHKCDFVEVLFNCNTQLEVRGGTIKVQVAVEMSSKNLCYILCATPPPPNFLELINYLLCILAPIQEFHPYRANYQDEFRTLLYPL